MQRILVALDASPGAHDVLAAGIDLAKQSGGKLLLLRAVAMPAEPLPANAFSGPPTALVDGFIETARRDLAELAEEVPDELLEGATAQVGVAWDAICSHAREHDVDMIVIGSHHYGILDRIFGTTAAKVVNHSDRPVLVVRPHEAPLRAKERREEPPVGEQPSLRSVPTGPAPRRTGPPTEPGPRPLRAGR